MNTKTTKKSLPQLTVYGVVRNKNTSVGLAGYRISATSAGRQATASEFGCATSGIDGVFHLKFDQPKRDRPKSRLSSGVTLSIANSAGVEVTSIKNALPNTPCTPLLIQIDEKSPLARPSGPPTIDPFRTLQKDYSREFEALAQIGIKDRTTLLTVEARSLAERSGLPVNQWEALQLHTELAHAVGFSRDVAVALVAAGIKTRAQIAATRPTVLVRALESATKRGVIAKGRPIKSSVIYGWVGHAMGFDPAPFAVPMNLKRVLTDAKRVTDRVRSLNPRAEIIAVSGLLNPFNRLQAMARVRSLMEAAGVYDLSALGTFRIRGQRLIHPGYYVAHHLLELGIVSNSLLATTVINRGAGFAHLKNAIALEDAIHLIPNPVTDAVIIGSMVEFIEDGRLIIGKDVTSLVIITEEILYSQLNEIAYEDSGRVPEPRSPMVPDRGATGNPLNDRNVYSPGDGDSGRNGGPGSAGNPGGHGTDGNVLGPGPDVEIYVQRTPQGMPKVRLGGRRGGTGQPGQHGGHGSDGARGREACSGACYCHRSVGHGGNGGDGGLGGDGGVGGAGGSGGDLLIATLVENIAPLTTLRPLFVDISGGPGGNGGDTGVPGEGGRGGAPGDDSWPWCDAEPGRVGGDGQRGPVTSHRGDDGPDGADGSFTLQPITFSDWNAVFNKPWIVRLEPWEGPPGTPVHVVAKNITTDTTLRLDGTAIAPTGIDVAGATLDFLVPLNATGGLRSVQLRLMSVSGELFSNMVTFRVTPQLTSLTPVNGVPGTTITLSGRGFANGAQVRFGGVTLPATFISGESLRITLPDHENIAMPAGDKDVQVVNPDGRESGVLSFNLTLDVVVRVKAWLVFPDIWVGGGGGFGGPGPSRDADDVRDIFMESNTAGQVWVGHHIILQFDPNVGIAVVPADLAESWTAADDATHDGDAAVLKARDAVGNFLHFEEGAVNFYFVADIDDWTTHAYTYRGSETRRQDFIIYEDTGSLSDWEEAHVAAHELGHVFGLPHVCDDENSADTTFGRACNQDNDKDFLMYPSTNFWTDEGNTLTVEEARKARRVARLWHNL